MIKCFIISLIILIFVYGCTNNAKKDSFVVKHPEWSYNSTIYEVNLRQYSENGTFAEFSDHLPRLKELGVEILWFMPIHPIGEVNRKGPLGSYYAVKDYKGVNPEFGTKEEFKELVEKAHQMGFKVILDWVANHSAWDNPWTKTNPEFYTKDSSGNFVPPIGTDWSDVIDLNYDNKQLWKEMISALEFWVKEFDVDGYRCDVAGMVPIEFWIEARKSLDAIKPVFMLAEGDEHILHKAFDMTYYWKFKDVANAIAKGEMSAIAVREMIENDKNKFDDNDFRMMFITNHDENSWNGTAPERLGNAMETFAALSVVLPGMPLIYSGQEAGLDKALPFFEKDEILWKKHFMGDVYSTLFNFKRTSPALANGNMGGKMNYISKENDKQTLSFYREKDGQKVVSIFNLSDSTATTELNLSGKNLQPLLSNIEDINSNGISLKENKQIILPAWGYIILVN